MKNIFLLLLLCFSLNVVFAQKMPRVDAVEFSEAEDYKEYEQTMEEQFWNAKIEPQTLSQ